VLPHFAIYLAEVFVNLVLVVPAHDSGEIARWSVFEEIAELGVNFRLHVGLILARRGRTCGADE
jgi:hypothetical protein